MTSSAYLARLCAMEARYDTAPPGHSECLAAAGDMTQLRAQRAATQSRFFDFMARNAQRAIQAQCRLHRQQRNGPRLTALSDALRSARRQGLWWHDVKIQAFHRA